MIEFDFERDVEKMLPKPITEELGYKLDQKQRTIVCRHWLLGLCYKGDLCSHLHRLDKSKMPPCKHGNLCKIKNCLLKHVAEEELEECAFYKQGFCYNGPKCGRRHVRRTPEECPVEASFGASGAVDGGGKKLKTAQPNDNFKVTLCTHWLLNGSCPFNNDCHFAHGEDQINEGYQPNAEFLNDNEVYDPTSGRMDNPLQMPFPTTAKFAYFILQSPDLRSLAISKRRGSWAVPMRMVNEMNHALRSFEHVILYMSVRPLRGIYGVCRMSNMIPPMPQVGPAMSAEFPVQWLRSLRLSLRTIAQLKLGMTGVFVGRSSADGKFENKVGLDILLTAYRKPEWDWSITPQVLDQAEHGMRVVDPHKASGGMDTSEYYPTSGKRAAEILPPDVLFAPEWIERAALVPNDKGGGFQKVTFAPSMAALPPIPDFYTGTLPGFVFCAITPVVEEMLARKMLALPIHFKDTVIHPNTPLFIFDSSAQMLLGIFFADSPTTPNMEPGAFVNWLGPGLGGGSPLPVQLRFRVAIEVPPTPAQDPEVLQALGSYAKTLGGPLGLNETKSVANLLAKRVIANQMLASGLHNRPNAFGKPSTVPGTASGSGLYYQPPFRCVDTVPIDIKGNLYDMKRRLLGTNASAIIKLVDEVGTKNTIRVRIRGQGSGFLEGPQNQEFPQPLHFNVSADNEQLLAAIVPKIKAHVDQVRAEMQGFA